MSSCLQHYIEHSSKKLCRHQKWQTESEGCGWGSTKWLSQPSAPMSGNRILKNSRMLLRRGSEKEWQSNEDGSCIQWGKGTSEREPNKLLYNLIKEEGAWKHRPHPSALLPSSWRPISTGVKGNRRFTQGSQIGVLNWMRLCFANNQKV